MTVYKVPQYILKILHALNKSGFQAYIVGGAVRDLLLGRVPHDYDITTDARPKAVIELCRQQAWSTVENLGNNFGCVVAVVDNTPCEITTFRGESYGCEDAHRPSAIWYCDTLIEDLSRRDFTVNAMAMDAEGNVYDYFQGQQDLQKKILRTVGSPQKRFAEDALRMFRACRLVGELGFTYVQDENLLPAFGMPDTPYFLPVSFQWPTDNVAKLSLERVRSELEKLLLSPHAGKGLMLLLATGISDLSCRFKKNGSFVQIPILPELRHLAGLKQNKLFHMYDAWEHTLLAVDNSPRDLIIRWAMLLHDVAKGLPGIRGLTPDGHPNDHGHEAVSAKMSASILQRLGYTKKAVKNVVWLVAQHMRFAPILFFKHLNNDPQYTDPDKLKRTILKWLRSEANGSEFRSCEELVTHFEQLKQVYLADMGATHAGKNTALMQEGTELADLTIALAATGMPVVAADLDIRGRDLLPFLPHAQIGEMLAYLLKRVQAQNLPNEKNALLKAAHKKSSRSDWQTHISRKEISL